MPLIFAAALDRDEWRRYLPFSADLVKNNMATFFDFRGKEGEKFFAEEMDQFALLSPDTRVALDSGAYSAFTQNIPIAIEEYIDFLNKYEDQFFFYASLDNKADQRETYENYLTLRKAGFNPAPVWHAIGGDMGILREYMQDPDVKIICIGAIAKERITDDYAYKRLDAVFSMVGEYGKPLHSFGRTEAELYVRYPFASGDSTTWYNAGKYGLVLHWNRVDRTLRNIKLRNPKAMEKCFGPRAKVLLGQLGDKYTRPLYHIQAEHNLAETLKEEIDLTEYWARRGVVWEYDKIDHRYNLSSDIIERCRELRKKDGWLMTGDEGYTPGMYCAYLFRKKNYRPTRKWEKARDVEIPDTFKLLEGTEYEKRILHLVSD